MRILLFAVLLAPLLTLGQTDTSFYDYVKYADSAYATDENSLSALTWYANAITIAYNNPEGYDKATQAHALENAGTLAYVYELYGYARIFYTRALEFSREINDKDAVYRLIPKVALSYSAMRDANEIVDPPQADDFETAEVYYRVIAEPIYENGFFYAKINGGISDGLYENAVGFAFGTFSEERKDLGDRSNERIGKSKIYQLDTNTTWVQVEPSKLDDPFYQLYQGDMVQLLSRIPKREFKSIVWELALLQIIFRNSEDDPIYDYRQLLANDSREQEQEILDIMRLDILITWEWLRDLEDRSGFDNIFNDKLTGGRYKGQTVFEAMGATTTEDVRSFLGFVKVFPGKYMGTPWKINETYATWVLNNTPIGFDEFFGYIMAAETPEDYKKLIDLYYKEITEDEFFTRVNMQAEEHATRKEYETALAINKRAKTLAGYIEDQAYLGWAIFNTARIYDYANQNDSTMKYYEAANTIFKTVGDLQGQSFCLNNIGSLYDSDGQYEQANGYYRQAQAVKLAMKRSGNAMFYSLSKSSSGIGNAEYNLANYDSAIVAYQRGIAWADSAESLEAKVYAISLQTDLARVYKKRGQYGLASELYTDQVKRYKELGQEDKVADAYDNLADVFWSMGDYRASYNMYFDSYLIKYKLEDWSDAGYSLSNCAQALWNVGKLDSAIYFHEEAIKLRELGEDKRGVAYAYSKIAVLYKDLGKPDDAAKYYRSALDTYLEYGDSLKVAELATDIGDFFEKLKNYSKSLEYYQMARKIYENRGMRSEVAKMDAYEGYIYSALKDYNKAEVLHRKALTVRKEINERQSIMYSLVDLAWVELYAKYNMDTALIMLNEALVLALETGSTDYEAYCYESIANAYANQAQTEKAKDYYGRALTLYQANENVTGQSNMLCNLGSNELNRGNFSNALAYYNQSLALAREKKLTVQIANTYNFLSEYYYYTGEFGQSFAVIDSSYRLYTAANNEYGIANTHIVDGNTHNLIGNAPQSLRQYEIADSIYKYLRDPLSRATAINNMGTIRFFQGDFNESILLFDHCKRILDSTGIKSSLLVTVTGNLGEVYMEKGLWEESERWLNMSLALAAEMGANRQEWSNKVILAKLKFKQGKFEESIAIMQQPYTSFMASDEKMAIAECATNMGKAYRELNQLDSAQKYLDQSLAIYRSIGSRKHIWEPLYQLSQVEQSRNNNQLSIAYLREAVDTLEHLSGEIMGSAAQKKLFAKANDKMEIYQNLIEQLIVVGDVNNAWAYQEKLNIYGLTEQTRGEPATRGAGSANTAAAELDDLELKKDGIYNQLMLEKAKPAGQRSEEKIKELERRMTVAAEEYQNFVSDMENDETSGFDTKMAIEPAKLEQIRYDLDPDLMVLEYMLANDKLIIFAASADTLGAKVIDVEKQVIENFVNGYYNLLVNKADFEVLDLAAAQLYNTLIEPVRPMLNGKKKIAFVPSGILFKLPFHSLGSPKEGGMTYLIEEFDVFYINDITNTSSTQPMQFNDANLLAFGNADRSLPFAEKEVDQISVMFASSMVYKKDQAHEDLAKTTMNNFTIVHFATHGNLDPINFNQSFLTMAPNLDAGEDGKLTMEEIKRIPTLRGCQLIVLSACNTAVNDSKSASWINNPAKAFLTKGAKSTVASLWSVDDVATGKLMQNFYSNLKAGQNKVVALNNAQKSMLTSETHSHPYYWAAFELIGKWE
jgi:CHAT domain-containing protein